MDKLISETRGLSYQTLFLEIRVGTVRPISGTVRSGLRQMVGTDRSKSDSPSRAVRSDLGTVRSNQMILGSL